jgi:hypothetical protein
VYTVIRVAPFGHRVADGYSIMQPFRTSPDPIDRVACGRCGHPVWAHCAGDACADCESRDAGSVCTFFALTGFMAMTPVTYEEYSLS